MWDLNDSPDQRRDDESEGYSSPVDGDDDKGSKRGVGSVLSNSTSSSAVVIEDGSDVDEDGERGGGGRNKKRGCTSSKLFGFTVGYNNDDNYSSESEPPPVTRQFFPLDDSDTGGDTTTSGAIGIGMNINVNDGCSSASAGVPNFPRAHWVGVKFCQSEPHLNGAALAASAGKPADISQPLKKSRRGPRSRSSQYRGVTFYRRTGRWESHIWYDILPIFNHFSPFPFFFFNLLFTYTHFFCVL